MPPGGSPDLWESVPQSRKILVRVTLGIMFGSEIVIFQSVSESRSKQLAMLFVWPRDFQLFIRECMKPLKNKKQSDVSWIAHNECLSIVFELSCECCIS